VTDEDKSADDNLDNKRGIPPHILYPAMVIALLVVSAGAQVILLVAANSDGGVQIEEDYYVRATQWDGVQAQRSAANRAGLKVAVDTIGAPTQDGGRPVVLHVTDVHGNDVDGLTGVMRLKRPSLARPVVVAPIEAAVTGVPGRYSFALPLVDGLWDFVIDGRFDGDPVLFEVRYEVAP
jgi:hypothetical protein